MTYRSLMVYLDPDHANEAALRVTADLANLFKSQVTGVAAGLPVMPVHADGMIATSILEVDYTQLEEALRRCEGRFRAAMMPVSAGLPKKGLKLLKLPIANAMTTPMATRTMRTVLVTFWNVDDNRTPR